MNTLGETVSRYMILCEEFTGVRYLEDTLHANTWQLEADLVVVSDKLRKDYMRRGTETYQNITFWIENVLNGSLFINASDEEKLDFSACMDNAPVYCPGEPTDDLLIRLFRAKLTAIAGSNMMVGQVRLKCKSMNVRYVENDDKGSPLPALVADYVTRESLHTVPWWNRQDGFSMEMLRWLDDESPLSEFYADIEDPLDYASEMFGGKKEADIIEMSWTPKKAP